MIRLLRKSIFCYHPQQGIPYELTKPLPARQEPVETILRDLPKSIHDEGPNLEQLQALTYTPALYWEQRPGKTLRKKFRAAEDKKFTL